MPRPSTRRPWRAGYRAPILGGVLLGVGLVLVGTEHHVAAPATPTVDPRLILRPHSIHIAGVLSHGLRLSGTAYPAYPGRNVLRLAVQQGATPLARGGHVALSATMPGMAMPPLHATLAASDRGYRGALMLPMFGTYRVAVVISTPRARVSGTITLTLPLPGR
jgi:hypothetical protein